MLVSLKIDILLPFLLFVLSQKYLTNENRMVLVLLLNNFYIWVHRIGRLNIAHINIKFLL